MKAILNYINDESGAAAAEYALILGVIAVGIFGALQLLGGNINTAIRAVAGDI
jgi:pilus assembly protein Flp/PilA